MSDQPLSTRDLSYQRTRLSADRTLMSWIRTSLSMISFGFGMYKFFVYLRESNLLSRQLALHGPRSLGLALVGLGTLLLVLAIAEYFLYQRWLGRMMGYRFRLSIALLAAVLITLVGLMAILNLLYNVGPV